MKWTPEKLEQLKRRYPAEDNAVLAREFGCSRKALAYRAHCEGLRKSDAANEARYAALSRRLVGRGMRGIRREIATGTLITLGNVTTHLSKFTVRGGDGGND